MLALAADPGRHQHSPQRLRRPLLSARRRGPSLVQVDTNRAQRVAGQNAPRALADHCSLLGPDRSLVGFVAIRPAAAARHLAGAREFLVLASDAAALVVAFLARHGTSDPRKQLPLMRRKIEIPA